ncbi:MAG: Bro-N domain-containing protein [Paludibacteraceae bacterium]|nr:Bro-N domain-containing protein [Paludibacteraceae bacterium]
MSNEQIKLFENSPIRNYWDDDAEEWFFCILDIVQALTDTKDVRQYVKRMRQREPELNSVWGTICTPHQFLSSDGKMHSVNCSNIAGILRIIMAVPSPKAEPFKRWLSQVGAERIRQMQDPSLPIEGQEDNSDETAIR